MQYLKLFLLIFFAAGIFIPGCEDKTSQENIIAAVNGRKISLDEFRLFYELDPGFGIDSTGLPALYGALDMYIDRVLAWRKGERSGLSENETFKYEVQWETRQALLRQLYHEQVMDKIQIADKEIMDEMRRGHIRVRVRHLFSPDRSQAEEWFLSLKSGSDFKQLAAEAYSDTLLAENGGDLGWMELGQFDEDFAQAVELLRLNQISEPVKTKWGYHVIQLLDRSDDVLITEQEFQQNSISVRKKIKQRKNRQSANSFIKSFIGDLNPQPTRQTVEILLRAMVPAHELERHNFSRAYGFSNMDIQDLQNKLKDNLDLSLISYRNGNISLGTYLEKLYGIPLGNRPSFKSVGQFSNMLGIWIRDELLLAEAIRRNLDDHPDVVAEMNRFREERAYLYYIEQVYDGISVPDSVARTFSLEETGSRGRRGFHTLQAWQWDQAIRILHYDLRRTDSLMRIDSLKLLEENKKIDWNRRIPMIMLRNPS